MKRQRIKKDKSLLTPAIRVSIPTRKVFSDKSKYSRKSKHKIQY